MQGLNRQEIENYIIDLYHNQKKTFREIQKIVRKSPRDIKTIIDKHDPDKSFSFLHPQEHFKCLMRDVIQ